MADGMYGGILDVDSNPLLNSALIGTGSKAMQDQLLGAKIGLLNAQADKIANPGLMEQMTPYLSAFSLGESIFDKYFGQGKEKNDMMLATARQNNANAQRASDQHAAFLKNTQSAFA